MTEKHEDSITITLTGWCQVIIDDARRLWIADTRFPTGVLGPALSWGHPRAVCVGERQDGKRKYIVEILGPCTVVHPEGSVEVSAGADIDWESLGAHPSVPAGGECTDPLVLLHADLREVSSILARRTGVVTRLFPELAALHLGATAPNGASLSAIPALLGVVVNALEQILLCDVVQAGAVLGGSHPILSADGTQETRAWVSDLHAFAHSGTLCSDPRAARMMHAFRTNILSSTQNRTPEQETELARLYQMLQGPQAPAVDAAGHNSTSRGL